jgi:hypothetical protein
MFELQNWNHHLWILQCVVDAGLEYIILLHISNNGVYSSSSKTLYFNRLYAVVNDDIQSKVGRSKLPDDA